MTDSAQAYLILGAAGGIGSEICRRLRKNGHRVMLAGRSEEPLAKLARELDAPHRTFDATSVEQVRSGAGEALETFGRLDGIANCVGSILLKPAHLTTADEWQQTLATNLTSSFAVVRAAYATMKDSGGSVVLFSTAAARLGLPNHDAIAAAKAGVTGLMRSAAASYASCGLRFNCIAPGLVQTKLTERIWKNERAAEASRSLHALGRLGTAGDIASLAVWLLDRSNSWVSGEEFGVDGGLSRLRVTSR